ncbi:SCO family protein [Priestia megaterium]|uniref:SCO family protein n=1 Tax=Priestia megaterium TaxID=1404 RepID=UPI00203C233B|nr:SCO family protein [Priestia megaterium]MCM3192315.1 SCO family protein [Priestia megaterium]
MKQKKWLVLIGTVLLLTLSACDEDIKDPLNYKMDSFSYQDQNQQEYGLNELKGKVWVADFIFTSCTTVCPPMTAHMTKLQEEAKKSGIKNIEFVSFSVDPQNDSPQALKQYVKKFNGNLENWHLLTGYSQKEIKSFAMDNFKVFIQKPKDTDQIIHGTSFYLINQEGIVKKDYNGVSDVPYAQIIEDIKILQH